MVIVTLDTWCSPFLLSYLIGFREHGSALSSLAEGRKLSLTSQSLGLGSQPISPDNWKSIVYSHLETDPRASGVLMIDSSKKRKNIRGRGWGSTKGVCHLGSAKQSSYYNMEGFINGKYTVVKGGSI